MGHGDVRPGHQVAAGVDLDRNVRPPEPPGACGLRALPDQSAGEQLADVTGHRGGRKAREPGDGGPGDRAVVEDRAHHGTGARDTAGGDDGGYVGTEQGVARRAAADRLFTVSSRSSVAAGDAVRARRGRSAWQTAAAVRGTVSGLCFSRGEKHPATIRWAAPEGSPVAGRAWLPCSGLVTRSGAHTLEVDMTSSRQVCGSLHGGQRSRNDVTRSNHCPHHGQPCVPDCAFSTLTRTRPGPGRRRTCHLPAGS